MKLIDVTGAMGEALADLRARGQTRPSDKPSPLSAEADKAVLIYIDLVIAKVRSLDRPTSPAAPVDCDDR